MQNKGIGKTDANCKKYFSKFRLNFVCVYNPEFDT